MENLEWITHSQNEIHAYKNGLNPLGEKRRHTKLANKQILEIRELGKQKVPHHIIADKYPVERRQISRICQGTRWRHI